MIATIIRIVMAILVVFLILMLSIAFILGRIDLGSEGVLYTGVSGSGVVGCSGHQ